MQHQMAPQQTAKFRTTFFGQFFYLFEEGLCRQLCMDLDVVFTVFRGLGVLYNKLNVS